MRAGLLVTGSSGKHTKLSPSFRVRFWSYQWLIGIYPGSSGVCSVDGYAILPLSLWTFWWLSVFNFAFWNHFRLKKRYRKYHGFLNTLHPTSPDVNSLLNHRRSIKTVMLTLTQYCEFPDWVQIPWVFSTDVLFLALHQAEDPTSHLLSNLFSSVESRTFSSVFLGSFYHLHIFEEHGPVIL